MRALSQNSGTIVDRVRVVGSRVERVSAVSAVESLLGMASIDSRLPPSAVLFIRKLADPKPGLARLEGHRAGSQVEWARALQEEIDKKARSAARPALGDVGANSEAVWFADRAELLACLAADWCSGNAITRWWWQSLFRATDVTNAVVREWLASIEYVPAAFAKLAKRGGAIRFAAALPASAVSWMSDEIIRHFALVELRAPVSLSKLETNSRMSERSGLASWPGEPSRLTSNEVKELRRRWAPEAFSPRLDGKARVLLAAALMLERAPSVLRESGFATRLVASLCASDIANVIDDQEVREQIQTHTGRAKLNAGKQSQGDRSLASANRITASRPVSSKPSPSGKHPRTEDRVQQDGRARRIEPQSDSDLSRIDGPQSHMKRNEPAAAGILQPALETPTPAATSEPAIAAATIETRIETNLGGIFYLINAALALNLYGDFTTPLQPGIELAIWDFLALIGREFFGKRIQNDPVWALLVKLAGRRRREKPGSRFKPEDEWRMPPEWLIPFSQRVEWRYQTYRGRLIVRHPAGFTTLDVKLNSRSRTKDVETQLADETSCYSNIAGFKRDCLLPGQIRLRGKSALDRWTHYIADYLRARLVRALGIEPVRAPQCGRPLITTSSDLAQEGAPTEGRPYKLSKQLSAILLERTARVEVTPARLDVFFSLDELSVEIRLSGLDRNPGWVPAAGRVIAFHYD